MLHRLRVFVSFPFTADTEEGVLINVRCAHNLGALVRQRGHYPFVPHNGYYMDAYLKERYEVGLSYDLWMEWCFEWLRQCDAQLLTVTSPGVKKEEELARKWGLRIYKSVEELPTP